MDGDQTKDTLDALADLFLTGTIPGSARPVRVPPEPEPDEQVNKTDEQAGDGSSNAGNQLDGPESIPLRPKQRQRYDEQDDVANEATVPTEPVVSLRLTREDDEPDEPVDEHTLPDARVEALFVGNLPGWSGPWLVQYAHYLARQRGPVAVLHVDDDQIEIELVTAERSQLNAIDGLVLAGEADATNLFSMLDLLVFNVDAPVATWLVHLPAPSEPKQKSRAAQLDRWSVLTGADDTAIAAGHRLLSQLLQSGDGNGDSEQASKSHRVGAMVMGSDEAKSIEAVANFNNATANLLGHPIELIGYRAAMEPVHVKQFGPFVGESHWDRVAEYLNELNVSDGDLSGETPSESLGDSSIDSSADSTRAFNMAAKTVDVSPEELAALGVFDTGDDDWSATETETSDTNTESPAEPEFTAESNSKSTPASVTASAPDAPLESEPVVIDPVQAVAATPVVSEPAASPSLQMADASKVNGSASSANETAANQPDLASMLANALGGGVALEAKCPRQPDKQIVLDQQGNLHVLRQHVDSDVRGSIVDLAEARDWVSEHIDLLALTQRENAFSVDVEPTLHLFADDAKAAVAMVGKHGPSVKLHLVQRVDVGAESTWICTALN